MLDQYLKSFSRLRTDKNPKRGSALTAHQPPTKYFMRIAEKDKLAL